MKIIFIVIIVISTMEKNSKLLQKYVKEIAHLFTPLMLEIILIQKIIVLFNSQKPKNSEVKIFEEFKIQEKPIILSCISSDDKKEIFPLNEVLNFCFPSPPPIYHTEDDPSNIIQYDPLVNNITNIIFQNNSISGNDKITFNVYAYIFYENFIFNNKSISII